MGSDTPDDPTLTQSGLANLCVSTLDLGESEALRLLSGLGGTRVLFPATQGRGFWDDYVVAGPLSASVADASFVADRWFEVFGEGFFKIRLLVEGELRAADGTVLARGPQGLLYLSPGASREGYFAVAGRRLRMVVLHGAPALFQSRFGLSPSALPSPLDVLFAPYHAPLHHRFELRPALLSAVQRFASSRFAVPAASRSLHLEPLVLQVLSEALLALEAQRQPAGLPPGLGLADVERIGEARRHLDQHFVRPPGIAELARHVGTSPTRLKAAFLAVTGTTIYGYVLGQRMARAAELLDAGEQSIAAIAYAVGYEHPANFSHAFRRHFGQSPRERRRRGSP